MRLSKPTGRKHQANTGPSCVSVTRFFGLEPPWLTHEQDMYLNISSSEHGRGIQDHSAPYVDKKTLMRIFMVYIHSAPDC